MVEQIKLMESPVVIAHEGHDPNTLLPVLDEMTRLAGKEIALWLNAVVKPDTLAVVDREAGMTPARVEAYNSMVKRINAMARGELDRLVNSGRCPYEPEHLTRFSLGIFHCELCGKVVVAGLPHPRQ